MNGMAQCPEKLLLVTFLALGFNLDLACLAIDNRFNDSCNVLAVPVKVQVRFLPRSRKRSGGRTRTILWI